MLFRCFACLISLQCVTSTAVISVGSNHSPSLQVEMPVRHGFLSAFMVYLQSTALKKLLFMGISVDDMHNIETASERIKVFSMGSLSF